MEHGLCVYLETDKKKILLDTGASTVFIDNARYAGIDLREVDYVFLSHAHLDHVGGLEAFLQLNSRAKVLSSPSVFWGRYYSKRMGLHEIGSSFEWGKYRERFIFIQEETYNAEDFSICKCNVNTFQKPKANSTLFMNHGSGLVEDDFRHELIFCFGKEKLFIYTGCAHHGLLNILDTVRQKSEKFIELVLGGFHLPDGSPNQPFESTQDLCEIGETLAREYSGVRFMTGHCTGDNAFNVLKESLGQQLEWFNVGFETQLIE
jgi:7,8-dihydropterin-6-yl-methyl-4-(beta-D-ribofuranosyl)aminobenzene 5'-phosphate synthase